MNILIDDAIPDGRRLFAPLGRVTPFSGRTLHRDQLAACDALIVRSVTPITPGLLAGTPVRFVGTATSGTDHVDTAFLAANGIHFAYAPGSNARAVAEYVLAAIFAMAVRHAFEPAGTTIGIIGVGRIGCMVSQTCEALGMRVLHNDPPRAHAGELPTHIELDDLIARSDIITLHVPFVPDGPHATRNLINAARFAQMRERAILINTSRGDVLDEPALVQTVHARTLRPVLDVWHHEPDIAPDAVAVAQIATPHLAGYSLDGRARAARMIRDALVAWMADRQAAESAQSENYEKAPENSGFSASPVTAGNPRPEDPHAPPVAAPTYAIPVTPKRAGPGTPPHIAAIHALLAKICPLTDIDADLRRAVANRTVREDFDRQRRARAGRRDLAAIVCQIADNTDPGIAHMLRALGVDRIERAGL